MNRAPSVALTRNTIACLKEHGKPGTHESVYVMDGRRRVLHWWCIKHGDCNMPKPLRNRKTETNQGRQRLAVTA